MNGMVITVCRLSCVSGRDIESIRGQSDGCPDTQAGSLYYSAFRTHSIDSKAQRSTGFQPVFCQD